MRKHALVTFFFIMAYSQLIAQEATENFLYEDAFINEATSIESILYNNDIHKKEKAGKLIQAIGFRDGNEKHFIIHFNKKNLQGEWQSFFANNQPCDSGNLVKNLPDGEWKTWYKNGQLKSIRNYSSKKYLYIQADLKRNHPKDQRYQITRYAKTDLHVKRHFLPAYQTNKVQYNFSLLDKIKLNTADSEEHYIPPYKQCLHHGAFINYFENGLVKDSGMYINGLKHDLWIESTRDGTRRAFGYYSQGLKHGQWKYYHSNGELSFTEIFRHGIKISDHYF